MTSIEVTSQNDLASDATDKSADSIPVIDVSGMFSDSLEERKAVAKQVRTACHEVGFFYAINHGIDPKYEEKTFQMAKLFFSQSLEKKMKVFTGLVPDEYVGYHPLEHHSQPERKLKDLHEAFNWCYEAKYDPLFPLFVPKLPSLSIWPSWSDPFFKDTLMQHYTILLTLSRCLTRIFALSLHLPEDHFDTHTLRPEAGMRILHYPSQRSSETEQNGLGAHTDFECFTIVTQDSHSGLQVQSKSGNWIDAKPKEGALVVNVGDCFTRITNGFFRSAVHRVIVRNEDGKEEVGEEAGARYSCPFFFGFDRKMLLKAVETCVDEENPARYEEMTAGEYYKWRIENTKTKTSMKGVPK